MKALSQQMLPLPGDSGYCQVDINATSMHVKLLLRELDLHSVAIILRVENTTLNMGRSK